jgi:hypothetical protein
MGLDTYARLSKADGPSEKAPDSLFDGINLCGGMLSGGSGSASFRGKVYANIIRDITGVSLYTDEIPTEIVKAMAVKLSQHAASQPDCAPNCAVPYCTRCELTHLKRWFQVAADNDCVVVGWW